MGILSLKTENEGFISFPHALYSNDVEVQNDNRTKENMRKPKPYFSAKHKLYGYKTEMRVLTNGICVHVTGHERGGVPDIESFKKSRISSGCS